MIQPGAAFKDNLQQLPAIDGVARIEGEIAIGRFLQRLPGAVLQDAPVVQRRTRFRGYARCEVVLR